MSGATQMRLLTTFEAAARYLNFTRAAEELGLRQPAVSRQITALEDSLGARLFIRTKPRLTLTADGRELNLAVTGGFEQIRHAIDTIRARKSRQTLVVNATIGFASCFLMPRLAGFETAYPNVELELVTRDQSRAFDPYHGDVVLLFADAENLPGVSARKVMPEEMIAVCSPEYLPDNRALDVPALSEERLLVLNNPMHRNDWDRYFSGTGVVPPPPQASARHNSFMVYLQAALNGNGIALGWSGLLADMLSSARLRIACQRRVLSERGYFCCIMQSGVHKKAAHDFSDWVADPSCSDQPHPTTR